MKHDDKMEAIKLLADETGIPISDDQAKMMTRMQEREELHPDLKPWLEDSTVLGPFLKHPLVFMGVGNNGEMNAMANDAYKAKKESLKKAMDERNWFVVIHVMYERPYRLYGFQAIEEHLTDREFWELLGGIWTDSENIYQNEDEWHEYLHSERPQQEYMMDDDERAALEKLPTEFTVWRGFCVDGREFGYSWSIDKDKALWFAKRLCQVGRGDYPRLASGTAQKADVIAHFTGRGESEIVILPENLTDLKIEEL